MNSTLNYFKQHYFFIIPCALTLLVYGLLFGIYSVNNIDNPWSSAWIYNFFQHHMTYDVVFCDGIKDYWGVRFFSHIFCYVYGAILSIVGFSLHKIQAISYSFIIVALCNWFFIAKLLLKDKKLAFMFIILLALSGPVLNAANEARSDALLFFLMSSSFLLWMNQKYFFSLIVAFMAIETHPIGGLVFFYLLGYFICYQKSLILNPRFLLICAAGVFSGICLYLFFHYTEIHHLSTIYGTARDADVNNFIYAFFYQDHHLKFKEDLVVFLLAAVTYLFRYKSKDFYFLLTVLLLIVSSFIFTRANSHYVLFLYPAFWLLTLHAFSGFRHTFFKVEYLFIVLFLLYTNHYLHLIKSHQRVRQFNQYIAQVKSLQLNKNSYIYGDPIDYFAFYNYPGFRAATSAKRYDHFYLIEHVGTVFADDNYHFNLKKWHYVKIKTLALSSGGSLNVYQVEKLPK